MTLPERVQADYEGMNLTTGPHPMKLLREQLSGVWRASDLIEARHGATAVIAGNVICRQRPGTAKGITFVTIEDETGAANLIVRMDVWEKFYHVARTANAFIAHGRLQIHQGVIHVLVTKLQNLSEQLNNLRVYSRDFQ